MKTENESAKTRSLEEKKEKNYHLRVTIKMKTFLKFSLPNFQGTKPEVLK